MKTSNKESIRRINHRSISIQSKHLVLNKNNLNLNDIKQAINMLEKYCEIKKTIVFKAIDNATNDKNKPINNEELYCAIMTLYEIIRNLTMSPNSDHLRIINVDNELFKTRSTKKNKKKKKNETPINPSLLITIIIIIII